MTEDLHFTDEGLLPPGSHRLTFPDLRESILVHGPKRSIEPTWDSGWRDRLVDQAETMVRQLWDVGIGEVYLNGSFVEQKAHPNDIDGYFECDLRFFASGELQRELNKLDPHSIWTWDPRARRSYRGYTKKQLPMWHVYRVELYPHALGVMSGITDEHGNELQFPAAFRRRRSDGVEKGIVRMVPDEG